MNGKPAGWTPLLMACDVGFPRPNPGETSDDQQRVMADVITLLASNERMSKDALCAVTGSNSTAFHVLAARGYGIALEALLMAVCEEPNRFDGEPRTLSSRKELLEICHEANASDCTVLDCAYLSAKALAPMLEYWGMLRNPNRPATGSAQGPNRQNMARRLEGGGPPPTTNQRRDQHRWNRQGRHC